MPGPKREDIDTARRLARKGLPITVIADRLGRSRETVYRWKARGQQEAEEIDEEAEAGRMYAKSRPYVEFWRALNESAEFAEAVQDQLIRSAGLDPETLEVRDGPCDPGVAFKLQDRARPDMRDPTKVELAHSGGIQHDASDDLLVAISGLVTSDRVEEIRRRIDAGESPEVALAEVAPKAARALEEEFGDDD